MVMQWRPYSWMKRAQVKRRPVSPDRLMVEWRAPRGEWDRTDPLPLSDAIAWLKARRADGCEAKLISSDGREYDIA